MQNINETRDRVIKAAIDLFSSKGFRGTSIRDIADLAGMSISNIYYHFGNKEGLLTYILETTSRQLVSTLRDVCELNIDPLSRFKRLLEVHLRQAVEHHKEVKLFFLDEEHLSQENIDNVRNIGRSLFDIYMHEIENLQKNNLVRRKNLAVIAFNIFAMINWFMLWYRSDGLMSLDEMIEEMNAFILYGIMGEVQ